MRKQEDYRLTLKIYDHSVKMEHNGEAKLLVTVYSIPLKTRLKSLLKGKFKSFWSAGLNVAMIHHGEKDRVFNLHAGDELFVNHKMTALYDLSNPNARNGLRITESHFPFVFMFRDDSYEVCKNEKGDLYLYKLIPVPWRPEDL